MSGLSDADLRLRYLDWCATQIARRFLQLSPDEVWERANAPGAPPLPAEAYPTLAEPSSSPSSRFLQLGRRSTLEIARELRLPPFEEWRDSYLVRPEGYDADIVGDRAGSGRRD